MDFTSFIDYISYYVEEFANTINDIANNVVIIGKIIVYAPYIAAAFGIVLFIQFVIICSTKIHMSRMEEKLDKILKSSEAEKKESENGEDAK